MYLPFSGPTVQEEAHGHQHGAHQHGRQSVFGLRLAIVVALCKTIQQPIGNGTGEDEAEERTHAHAQIDEGDAFF